MQRIHSIDYLRGLMALAVLLYHFCSWSIGVPDASTVLGRLGLYAVSTFYIVSGMSLFVAYKDATWTPKDVGFFVIKRYLRLAPAFWVACTPVVIFLAYTSPTFVIPIEKIIGNYTLTFGFTAPDQYLTVGGWSIGNEMVFYAFFPLVMMLPRIRPLLMTLALSISFGFYCYFAFIKLTPDSYLSDQWLAYINPLNQAFLFFLGVAIAWASTTFKLHGNVYAKRLLAMALCAFCVHPVTGNQIAIAQGIDRIVFTALCGVICFAVFNIEFHLRESTQKLLYLSGCLSYSIYMFHGVFADATLHFVVPFLGLTTPNGKLTALLLITLPGLLVFTYLFYRYVELPVIGVGRHLKHGRTRATAADTPA